MDVTIRLKANDQAGADDLVWAAEQLKRWSDELVDSNGWKCILALEPMTDLENGEVPKSGSLRVQGMLERHEQYRALLGIEGPAVPENRREQLEAEMDKISPKGQIDVEIQTSDDDLISRQEVLRMATELLEANLSERPNVISIVTS